MNPGRLQYGRSALMLAAALGDESCILALLCANANVTLTDSVRDAHLIFSSRAAAFCSMCVCELHFPGAARSDGVRHCRDARV